MEANKKPKFVDGRSWWLKLKAGDLADRVILAIELDMPKKVLLPLLNDVECKSDFGEYQVYTGTYEGKRVSIVYHGSGAFSICQAIEEIAALGAKSIIRVGSCGGIAPDAKVGTVAVPLGTIRDDRMMLDYVPAEYPAVADLALVNEALNALQEEGIPSVSGISLSTATFYPGSGYETAAGILDEAPYQRVKLWQKLNALCVDIETSTVLLLARLFNMKGASVLCVSNHCITGEGGYLSDEQVAATARAAVKAVTRC